MKKMEVQDQLRSKWSHYFCTQLKDNSARLEGSSEPYSSIWTNTEPARFQSSNTRSFAMDARIRLDYLKSGCKSPLPCCAIDGTLHNYNCDKDTEPKEEESALDLVELLDVEEDEQDEESWLYESPRKLETVEKTQSALRWCRHVLDNPSPEMEAACRLLIHRLDERSSSNFYKRPVCPLTGNDAICSPVDRSSFNSAQTTSGGLDNSDLSVSHDYINTNYRLEDITDVHIMARIQEASLRQDCVSSSAVASPRRCPESAVKLLSYFNSTEENVDDFTPRNAAECSSSSYWQPALLPPRSSSSLLSPAAKQSSQSPKLATLHQQVTQFKLFKLTQNQGWTKSPARTSLRSLQAVRNSRSVETDGCNLTDHIIQPPSGSSSISRCSQSPSAARMNSNVSLPSARDSSIRVTSMKKLQRSQSLSPCRIPHPAKGCLSFNGRVFASPETLSTVAWTRNGPSARQ